MLGRLEVLPVARLDDRQRAVRRCAAARRLAPDDFAASGSVRSTRSFAAGPGTEARAAAIAEPAVSRRVATSELGNRCWCGREARASSCGGRGAAGRSAARRSPAVGVPLRAARQFGERRGCLRGTPP